MNFERGCAINTCAFVTYNQVGDTLSSGWHDSGDRRALLIQNSRGFTWGAREERDVSVVNVRLEDQATNRVVSEIETLWGQLQQALPELDHIVVYVGSRGSERAIELASQLPACKVTFVGCECGLPIKEAMLQRAGLGRARRVLCECGGRQTMEFLYKNFMQTGELLPIAAVA